MSSQDTSGVTVATLEPTTEDIRRPEPAHINDASSSPAEGPVPGLDAPRPPQPPVIPPESPAVASPSLNRPPPPPSERNDDESLNFPTPDPPARDRRHPLYVRLRRMLGIEGASEHRKAMMTFATDASWALTQLITITTLLILCGTRFRDTSDPRLSEWQGCDRPLGVWASIWVVRAFFKAILAVLFLMKHYSDNRGMLNETDPESARRAQGANATSPPAAPPASPSNGTPGQASAAPARTSSSRPATTAPPFRYRILRDRLTLLCSLLTPVWFLTAHILEYTSMNTCRHSSPHLWWLVFGIICIIYAMILEVVLIGFVVLIVAPIIFLLWNIILICIGRHPLQQRPLVIKNEIAKLPKSVVDRIPLVVYIPPPPDEPEEKEDGPTFVTPTQYPPQAPKPEKVTKKRFRLLRLSSKSKGPTSDGTDENTDPAPREYAWEEHWEQGDYPFVRLTGNQATCSICLVDYDAPRRRNVPGSRYTTTASPETDSEPSPGTSNPIPPDSSANDGEQTESVPSPPSPPPPPVNDSAENPEPLRLLACSHVFHKSCLDPWLLDMSGRCPVCQRPVEAPPAKKTRRRR